MTMILPLVAAETSGTASLFAGPNSPAYYVISAVLVILVLVGLKMLSSVKTAVNGNLLGAFAMLAAIVATLWNFGLLSAVELYVAMLIGAGLGAIIWRKTKMIRMPQTVALLNGFGGMASMIAGILTLVLHPDNNTFALVTAGLAVAVGGATFFGSMIAAGKLQQILAQRPVVLPAHSIWVALTLVLSLGATVAFAFPPFNVPGVAQTVLIVVEVIAANLFGYLLAVRVGGADMPITISLLNSLSGVAGAIAGLAISDLLLVAIGAIVGASGLLLTQIMCRAMNRHLLDILLGKTSVGSGSAEASSAEAGAVPPGATQQEPSVQQGASESIAAGEPGEMPDSGVEAEKPESLAETAAPATPAATLEPTDGGAPAEPTTATAETDPQETIAGWIGEASRVIIVPGYGMALAQAQEEVKRLYDFMERAGKTVDFAIHPVAGRMPGHMNVLLAEVDVDYDKLREMQEINDEFASADLTIVVGANDVINPAANTAEGTPIYGMPVLRVGECRRVAIFNFDLKPGYAGVDNPLYARAKTNPEAVALALGDAAETLAGLNARLAG
ncbi:MAG: NAD(P)(+) transhydrogenase (Re/Si-specific) subunit beta [Mobiluncus porci]|uniref:NAD(P)(+) transhydrogenase (Re/Si-specific) subunit beta n=1 Tax=Mobiluncus porci TaxID=2652278 RepID=UPI0023F0FE84|nr:NAD(P)(+) transhydrogenase (Re/Si-specific) subunit beta [Mobiluncus porci]MDD7540847.1 NAD(P)(+) transhydrogenase (Re/Si-specific) subunit beta [Mobiluncus porci]MDY5749211.1 NAD(P)(+) transhydrogenase (Re/Si-specific) subunit beta [Mobiluncus porci]